jgi:glycosyltransferase involved in cell wall biosynthesis
MSNSQQAGESATAAGHRPLHRRALGKVKGLGRRVLGKARALNRDLTIHASHAPAAPVDLEPVIPYNEADHGDDPAPRRCAFLVSTTEHASKINSMVGAANYSYFFVYKYFEQLLKKFGPCELVSDPERNIHDAARKARREGYLPVHLSFNPPHEFPATPTIPTMLLPQWEFPQIPDRDLGGDPKQNWVTACNAADLIVASSTFTGDCFRHPDIRTPVALVPIPLAPTYAALPDWDPNHSWTLTCRHHVFGGGEPARPTLPPPMLLGPAELTLSGYVYSSAFNICDQRKNYVDMLSAFLHAFQDRPDVTLVLKLNAPNIRTEEDCNIFKHIYYTLNVKHACRVVVIMDYFEQSQMLELLKVSTFYVSTSKAEGANMILQQALAAGRPSIAPANTAMIDYIDPQVGFVVGSHPEPTPFPHDPEHAYETVWHRLVWSDLRDQYRNSLALLEGNPGRYEQMARTARRRIADFAGHDRVAESFRDALKLLPQLREHDLILEPNFKDSALVA